MPKYEIKCKSGFRSGDFQCPENFEGELPAKSYASYASFSILMHLKHNYCNSGGPSGEKCCAYCCCQPLKPEDHFDIYQDGYEANYPKMIAKIKSCPISINKTHFHFDLWGGEPFFNFKALKELTSVLRKEWSDCSLTVSTNGLLLGSESIIDWIIDNKVSIQLSHDGLGQWIRTGKVDPLENANCLRGLKRINDAGLFTAINCTLTKYNYSWFKNIKYFNEKLKAAGIDKLRSIKLNHIYDSDYDIKALNVDGKWQDGFREDLINQPIGNLAIEDEIADEYFNEFFTLACYYRDKSIKKDYWMNLYKDYILEQSKRWRELKHSGDVELESSGICRAYQSYKYNLENNFKSDYTFVVTTLGEYSECNLTESVERPGNPEREECKSCKYRWQAECRQCGSMATPVKCNNRKKWLQTLEKIHNMDTLKQV